MDDTRFIEFLLIVILRVNRNKAEILRVRSLSEYLDCTYCIKDYSVYFTVLNVIKCTVTKGNNVAMANLWLHGMPCDITPKVCFFKSFYNNIRSGYIDL